eukprot:358829-Chlamydomonas_euryale.AAC.17
MTGAWDIRYAPELRWAKGDMWTTVLEVPACGVHEYKYVIVDGSTKQEMAWQQGNNSVLAVGPDDTELSVYDNWANNLGAAVAGANGKSMTRAEKLQEWASGLMKERAMVEQWKRDNQGLKSEIARQRMEMGLMAQAAREREEQIMRMRISVLVIENPFETVAGIACLQLLRRENERLQSELAISKTEMAGSFEEALRLPSCANMNKCATAVVLQKAATMDPTPTDMLINTQWRHSGEMTSNARYVADDLTRLLTTQTVKVGEASAPHPLIVDSHSLSPRVCKVNPIKQLAWMVRIMLSTMRNHHGFSYYMQFCFGEVFLSARVYLKMLMLPQSRSTCMHVPSIDRGVSNLKMRVPATRVGSSSTAIFPENHSCSQVRLTATMQPLYMHANGPAIVGPTDGHSLFALSPP